LPPYSPELNPGENAGPFLRQHHFSNRFCKTYDATLDTGRNSWSSVMAEPARITAIAMT
jgi:hypothetical protein